MGAAQHLPTEPAACTLCGPGTLRPHAAGADFEYHTSDDRWRMARCTSCHLLVLDPRPTADQFDRIYPPSYHAFAFTPEKFGLAHRVRCRLEATRLLRAFAGLPARARILDVGCGDGFHLSLLREFGPGWQLLGVDPSERATHRAAAAGLSVRVGTVESLPAADGRFDAALMIMTVEHLADPLATVRAVRDRLNPGGRLVVVTDNAGSAGRPAVRPAALGRLPLPAAHVPVRPPHPPPAGRAGRVAGATGADSDQPGERGVLGAERRGRTPAARGG